MTAIIRYEKPYYEAKITELEGFYNILGTHLDRLKELKEQMFQFWDDDYARKAAEALVLEINHVQTAMDRTAETLTFYRTTITEYEGKLNNADESFEKVISALQTVGGVIGDVGSVIK